ncbi:MAG TPA: dockerin type I repeat-containing protein [Pirellulales bacterium]|nr:dockerin type I repeat-containing protein [Pirellulales bacterium]
MKHRRFGFAIVCGVAAMVFGVRGAQADVLESWENTSDPTFDGWSIPPSYSTTNYANFSASYNTTYGVTNGLASVAVASTPANDASMSPSGPNYGQMIANEGSQAWTTMLSHAAGLSFDVYLPPGSFGYYTQFDLDLNNADAGYTSIDSYHYLAANNGAETTMKFYFQYPAVYESLWGTTDYNNINASNAAYQALLATSTHQTGIFIQMGGGYSAGPPVNETAYFDNVQIFYELGDFNFDHHVDAGDIIAMEQALANPAAYEATNDLTNNDLLEIGDLNGDGKVNNADLQYLISYLNFGEGSLSRAVPEPASLMLLGLAAPALAAVAHRRRKKLMSQS